MGECSRVSRGEPRLDKLRLTLVMSLYVTRFKGGKPPSSSSSSVLSRFPARRVRKFQEECFYTSKQQNRNPWGFVFLFFCETVFNNSGVEVVERSHSVHFRPF